MHHDDERLGMKEREREKGGKGSPGPLPLWLPKFVFRSVLQFRCANGGGYMVTMMMW